jgi:hypothetical protein
VDAPEHDEDVGDMVHLVVVHELQLLVGPGHEKHPVGYNVSWQGTAKICVSYTPRRRAAEEAVSKKNATLNRKTHESWQVAECLGGRDLGAV